MYEVDFSDLPLLLNDWIKDIWNTRKRYVVCKGGGGSGKSFGIVEMLVYRIISEPGHKILVVRKVGKTLRESCFSLIQEVINLYGCSKLFKINKTDMTIECINGNKFIFSGLDDVEKLKSINAITDILIEEASELEPGDYRQLNIRLRGNSRYPKQMFILFNPISITHWLKAEFFDRYVEDAEVIETTYKDNKFLDDEAKKVLEGFKETDPYYYMVYCLGEWGVIGRTIFNAQIVSQRIAELRNRKPIKKGFFAFIYENEKIVDSSIKWIDDDNGYVTIYEDVKKGYPYVIGGDTAGDGSDSFASHVLDNSTGKQVAVLKHQFDEDLYTRQMYCLGKYYNEAVEGIETNFSTFPVKELQRLGYRRQYVRQAQDTYTGKTLDKFGFRTDKLTRPMIIANLVMIVREHIELINDIPTLEEMLTFVRNEKGKAEAQEGKHDDLIISLAISYEIRSQQSFNVKIEPVQKFPINSMEERVQKNLEKLTNPKRRKGSEFL